MKLLRTHNFFFNSKNKYIWVINVKVSIKTRNNIRILIIFLSFLGLISYSIIDGYGQTTEGRLNFSSNAEIAGYFRSNPAMDGLSWETAFIFEDITFEDDGQTFGVSTDNRMINIANTNCHIIFRNCIFTKKDTSAEACSLYAIYMTNCSNIKIELNLLEFLVNLALIDSSNITIQDNTFENGKIDCTRSYNSSIVQNDFSINLNNIKNMKDYFLKRGTCALRIIHGDILNISENSVTDYTYGLSLFNLTNCEIRMNKLIRARYDITPELNVPELDDTNTVNNRKVCFYFNKSGLNANNFTNAGQVYIWNCTNSIVEGAWVEYLEDGFQVKYCCNLTIRNNVVIFPMYSGIYILSLQNSTIINNTILGFSYDTKKFEGMSVSNMGINLHGYTDYTYNYVTDNLNITMNTVSGYEYGILVWTYESSSRAISNITIWDNYFADNEINGLQQTEYHGLEYSDVRFNNSTIGNYWDDYESPRIATGLPSASGTYSASYKVNDIYDYHPLTSFDHPLYLPDLEPLLPWGGMNIWMIFGIIIGATGITSLIIVIIIKKQKTPTINT